MSCASDNQYRNGRLSAKDLFHTEAAKVLLGLRDDDVVGTGPWIAIQRGDDFSKRL